MENREWKTENKSRRDSGKVISNVRYPFSANINCPACGTRIKREFAKFCRVCGKSLNEDYEPLDTLRASYRLQGKSFQIESKPIQKEADLFEEEKNSATSTAWAFVVYSMVPYLGILFCPGAILMGSIGIYVSYRKPYLGGRKTAIQSIALSFIILAVQIFLWWLLYFVPKIGQQM